ncbi:MAG: ABC transporter permease [Candidatus Parcubacteria bacterium]|nr:ABC transporter permease [Candidatus Parcubacteria bacterium]
MILKHSFTTALKGLKNHQSRSILTILGIVIGITAIILVMSIGQGAQDLILQQIKGLGSQTIIIEPGREPEGPSSFTEIFTDSLKQKDVDMLKNPERIQGIKNLTPIVVQIVNTAYENNTTRATVLGASELLAEILEIYPLQGTTFSEDDVKQRANVAVLGSEIKRKLFGPSDAVGEKIKIKGKTFRVLGVLPPKGQVSLFNVDETITIPYTTAQQYLIGTNFFNSIIVQVENEKEIDSIKNNIEQALRESHNIQDPSKDDFHAMTQADVASRVSNVTGILTVLLLSVAAISLVVGGIGIMNIMLVSVFERTREIGLRKSIGATEKDILVQFLLESIILTVIGGIAGIILGALLSFATSLILTKVVSSGWVFVFPVSAALLGIGVATMVGLIFGLYPARQASLKSPIEALRYE